MFKPNNYDWIISTVISYSRRLDDKGFLFDKDTWSLIIDEISSDYDDQLDELFLEVHAPPFLHSEGFC